MIIINKNIQSEILMTTIEEIVPKDSLFHKIDKYIDFYRDTENALKSQFNMQENVKRLKLERR